MKHYLTYQDSKSNKFWEIETSGKTFTVRFGKIDTKGQTQTKEFATEEQCLKEANKLVSEKLKKGYKEVIQENPLPEKQIINSENTIQHYIEFFEKNKEHCRSEISTEEHIQEYEKKIGFSVPEQLKKFWLAVGGFQTKREFQQTADFTLYGAGGNSALLNSNNLYTFLYQIFFDKEKLNGFSEEEINFLNDNFIVYGTILSLENNIDYYEVSYFDISGQFGKIKFENVPTAEIKPFLQELLQQKERLQPFLKNTETKKPENIKSNSSVFDKIASLFTKKTDEEKPQEEKQNLTVFEKLDLYTEKKREREKQEEQEPLPYGLENITYDECLKRLNVAELFKPGKIESDNEQDEIDWSRFYIFFHDGDLEIDGNFNVKGCYFYETVIVVKGNLTIKGSLSYNFYVTGNVTVDKIFIYGESHYRYCGGKFQVKYMANLSAEDDEATISGNGQVIDAPYFVGWYVDLYTLQFSPQTIIFIMGDRDDVEAYKLKNIVFKGQDALYALKPELYYNVGEGTSESFLCEDEILKCLQNKQSIFIDGFNPQCMHDYYKGVSFSNDKRYKDCFLMMKKVIEISPNFYLAYAVAANSLSEEGAYKQSLEYYQKAIELFPSKLHHTNYSILNFALYSIRLGDLQTAMEYTEKALKQNDNNYYVYRVRGEIYLLQNNLTLAKQDLLKAQELNHWHRTTNWLLGFIYYKEGDKKNAEKHFTIAIRDNYENLNVFYDKANDLSFFYKKDTPVDWETKTFNDIIEPTKDETYWLNVIQEKKSLEFIPEEHRTLAVCEKALEYTGRAISLFPENIITQNHCIQALTKPNGYNCKLREIPKKFIDKELCKKALYVEIEFVPQEILDYEICYDAVSKNCREFEKIPNKYKDEEMHIIAITSGALDKYGLKFSSKYYTASYIKKAIDKTIQTLNHIPVELVDKEIYDYTGKKYGNTPKWKEIISTHNRDSYKILGKQKYNYDVLDHVWKVFWDEKYLLDVIKNADIKLYAIPQELITEKIAEIAFEKDKFNFTWMPKQFMTLEMCKKAAWHDYGHLIEYMPIKYRTKEVCEISVRRNSDTLRFVPLEHRTKEVCIGGLKQHSRCLKYIPYEQYVPIFTHFITIERDEFYKAYPYTKRGIGYFYENKFEKALEDFSKVLEFANTEEASESNIAESTYYTGWCYYKMGKTEEAKKLFEKSQELFKNISEDSRLTEYYDVAAFPPIEIAVWEFSKGEFDFMIEKAQNEINNKSWETALQYINKAEELLNKSQCSEMTFWAVVWDFQRYALYEAGKKEEARKVCQHAIEKLSKVQLWSYLETHNHIRATLRSAHNMLAYHIYETGATLEELEKGIEHIEKSFSIIAPIEDKKALFEFYETKALLFKKAAKFNPKYETKFEKILTQIESKKLVEKGFVHNEELKKYHKIIT